MKQLGTVLVFKETAMVAEVEAALGDLSHLLDRPAVLHEFDGEDEGFPVWYVP